jgi:hypothetical protein
VNGANIAGFLKVANAMMDQGVVSRGSANRWRGGGHLPDREMPIAKTS